MSRQKLADNGQMQSMSFVARVQETEGLGLENLSSIFEKSKMLVERRNNAVGATPPGEGKDI